MHEINCLLLLPQPLADAAHVADCAAVAVEVRGPRLAIQRYHAVHDTSTSQVADVLRVI